MTDISRYSAENVSSIFSPLCFSYYQVIVRELATDNTDQPVRAKKPELYSVEEFNTYEEARKRKPQLVPYIAAEFRASDFDRYQSFVVGDGSRTSKVSEDMLSRRRKREEGPIEYYNGPLEENTFYAVFQRAYVNKVSMKGLPQIYNCLKKQMRVLARSDIPLREKRLKFNSSVYSLLHDVAACCRSVFASDLVIPCA